MTEAERIRDFLQEAGSCVPLMEERMYINHIKTGCVPVNEPTYDMVQDFDEFIPSTVCDIRVLLKICIVEQKLRFVRGNFADFGHFWGNYSNHVQV